VKDPRAVIKLYAKTETVLRLHNDEQPALACALHTGITGDLARRVFDHKNKLSRGFTSRYNLTRLVYCETFNYPGDAIAREKQIKGWIRSKKIKLVESINPTGTTWPRTGKTCTSLSTALPPSRARSFAA
jgi:putative endonuclease